MPLFKAFIQIVQGKACGINTRGGGVTPTQPLPDGVGKQGKEGEKEFEGINVSAIGEKEACESKLGQRSILVVANSLVFGHLSKWEETGNNTQ